MCSVSAVSDYYMNTWPQRFPQQQNPFATDHEARQMLREVIERLDKLDKRLGDIECHDDVKVRFLKMLEDRL